MQIDYGRLSALEYALGGREAIQKAYAAKCRLAAPETVRVERFDFKHDAPGLAAEGVAFHTPCVGEVLLGVVAVFTEAWNGTTPLLDIGQFVGKNVGLLSKAINEAVDATNTWIDGGGDSWGIGPGLLLQASGPETAQDIGIGASAYYLGGAVFTSTDPLRVVVSQTGQKGDASPGATQGEASIYTMFARP